MIELIKGHSYLVRECYSNNNPRKLTVLEVSKTSYRIEWENEYRLWTIKNEFEKIFEIIEDMGELILSINDK